MRLNRFGIALFAVFSMLPISTARADILISIDKSAQQMTVTLDGKWRYVWPVSTGALGYDTPSGGFKPFRMERDHFSREWDDAPMPHSIFFTKQATPFTALVTSGRSGGRCRMAACGSSRGMPAFCSPWWSGRG